MAHVVNVLSLPKVYGANTAERRHVGVKSVGHMYGCHERFNSLLFKSHLYTSTCEPFY